VALRHPDTHSSPRPCIPGWLLRSRYGPVRAWRSARRGANPDHPGRLGCLASVQLGILRPGQDRQPRQPPIHDLLGCRQGAGRGAPRSAKPQCPGPPSPAPHADHSTDGWTSEHGGRHQPRRRAPAPLLGPPRQPPAVHQDAEALPDSATGQDVRGGLRARPAAGSWRAAGRDLPPLPQRWRRPPLFRLSLGGERERQDGLLALRQRHGEVERLERAPVWVGGHVQAVGQQPIAECLSPRHPFRQVEPAPRHLGLSRGRQQLGQQPRSPLCLQRRYRRHLDGQRWAADRGPLSEGPYRPRRPGDRRPGDPRLLVAHEPVRHGARLQKPAPCRNLQVAGYSQAGEAQAQPSRRRGGAPAVLPLLARCERELAHQRTVADARWPQDPAAQHRGSWGVGHHLLGIQPRLPLLCGQCRREVEELDAAEDDRARVHRKRRLQA